MKILFVPIGVASGIIAGIVARKTFEKVWGLVDEEEPPDPHHRNVSTVKMVAALALEGAVFSATKGLVDHASRRGFMKLTGSWPGEEEPEPEES